MARTVNFKEVGPPNTPADIKRLRRQNMDFCRKMGQPVVFRHKYGPQDVDAGIAEKCPACYDNVYNQARSDCPVCYGFGFASVELNPQNVWIDTTGQVIIGNQPAGGIKAPRYGGFGVPYLTWLVEPDIAVDTFRINEQGVMAQTYNAQGTAPWFPTLGDNDLCVNVTLSPDGYTILSTLDRFQLKMAQQVTIRGFGKLAGPQTNGNPFLVAQSFEMNKVPVGNPIYNVPVDEPWY